MTENQFEGVNIYWLPDVGAAIDLTDAVEIVRNAADEEHINASWQGTLTEMWSADNLPEPEEMPEETLIETYDSEGRLIAHAEVFNNDDGSGTIKFYGIPSDEVSE